MSLRSAEGFLARTSRMMLTKLVPGIVEVSMKGVITLPMIAQLMEYLEQNGIKVVSAVMSRRSERGGEMVSATMFLDFSKSKVSIDEFLKHVERFKLASIEVLDVPLSTGAINIMSFTLNDAKAMLSTAHEMFKSAGKAFLYYLGLGLGKRKAEEVAICTRIRDPLEYAVLWAQSMGWGEFAIRRSIGKVYVLARNLFECFREEAEEVSPEPRSQIFRGFLAGFLSRIWGKDVKVVEIKCTAKGDECCEFEITPS